MKKRKKRRSKTKGGDKPPFDDEMGKNQKAIKVLQRLFDAGYGTEKEIVNMTMDEMLALPGVNVADLCIISDKLFVREKRSKGRNERSRLWWNNLNIWK